jgi:hypothetical protein
MTLRLCVALAVVLSAAGAVRAAPPVKVLPPVRGLYHGAFPGFCGSEDCVAAERIRAFGTLAAYRTAIASSAFVSKPRLGIG